MNYYYFRVGCFRIMGYEEKCFEKLFLKTKSLIYYPFRNLFCKLHQKNDARNKGKAYVIL